MKKSKIIASLLVIALLFQYVATLSYAYENITEEIKNDEVALLNDETSENTDLADENEKIEESKITTLEELNNEDINLNNDLNEESNKENEDLEENIVDSKENKVIENEDEANKDSVVNNNEDVKEEKINNEQNELDKGQTAENSEDIFKEDTANLINNEESENIDKIENEDSNLNKEQVLEDSQNIVIEENNSDKMKAQSVEIEKSYIAEFETSELKGTMCIDTQSNNPTYNIPGTSIINVSGWAVSTDEKATLKLYINNVFVDSNFSRISRSDVDSLVSPDYGGTSKNPNAGFTKNVDISGLSVGKHTLKIEQVASNGTIISTAQKDFYINDASKSGSMCIDSVDNEARYNLANEKTLTLNGWAVSYTQNATIDVYINNVRIISNANRISRPDVDNLISPSFGGTSNTPKAGFAEKIDISNYKSGEYTLRVEQVDSDGFVISKLERKIYIDKTVTNQGHNANLCIDYPSENSTYNVGTDKSFQVNGWAVSTDKNSTVRAYVNNVPVVTNIERISRPDVDSLISPNYGGTSSTPKAGFVFNVDISKLTAQNYTLTVEEISSGGAIIGSVSKNFTMKNETLKGSVCIDYPLDSKVSYVPSTSSINVSGWAVSNSSNVIIKAYINNVCVISNLERNSRPDVDKLISPSFGGTSKTPNAGFSGKLDISNLKAGTYTLKIEETTSSGTVIASSTKKLTIKNDTLEGTICIDKPSSNTTYTLPDDNKMKILGWAVSTDKNSTVRAYINNNLVISNMGRNSRSDVDKLVSPLYGGTDYTPQAGFYGTIDISQYKNGTYTLKVEEVASNGKVICSQEKIFTIKYRDCKGSVCIDNPVDNQVSYVPSTSSINVSGWAVSDSSDVTIKAYINNVCVISNMERNSRPDVDKLISPSFGGTVKTPNAGFSGKIDISNLKAGTHTLKIEETTSNGTVIASSEKKITIKEDILEGSLCIDKPSVDTVYTLPDNNKIAISGWAVSTDSQATVKAYINNNLVISNMERNSRSDVDKLVSPSYGGTAKTPKAGFNGTIDISQYKKGTYTLKIEEVASNGKVISSQETKFTIKYADYKGTIFIDYPAENQLQTTSNKTLLIQGWVLSEDSEDIIQVSINGNGISSISRYSRADVEAISDEYGGKSVNLKAGFSCSVDTSSYAEGKYTVTVNLLNRWGELLKTASKTIEVSHSRYAGVDVSYYNGTLDWQSLKNQGIAFAILRIGYGQNSNQLDTTFEYNYEQCKKYGIKVGVYLYSYAMSTEDSVKEAQNTLNWLKGRSLDLPVYYDIENETASYYQLGLSKDTLTNMAITYMDIIQNAGYKAGLYSSKYWLEGKFDMSKIEDNYSVWVAHYTSMLTTTYSGKKDIWQYKEGTKGASGLEGCDLNYCYRKTFFE